MDNKDLTKYPRLKAVDYQPQPIPIKDMSIAYLKTQIERIEHVKVNEEYLDNLKQEYKKRTLPVFKKLS